MKPTSQTSSQRNPDRDNANRRGFPLTDYSFQATREARTSSSGILLGKKLRAFRNLSTEFFGTETRLDYVAEAVLFALFGGISAWPIVSMIVAVTRLVRNY
jgi:hypothetical protein